MTQTGGRDAGGSSGQQDDGATARRPRASISTKRGDDGTTGLLFGGRVPKTSARIDCNGAVDEAQAALGLARAELRRSRATGPGAFGTDELDALLVGLERDLWVLMAEVATAPRNRRKLQAGSTLVTVEMVEALGALVEKLEAADVMPAEFVVPGGNAASAALDLARTVVRRAERLAVGASIGEGSLVVPYLNRLSDVCWLLARAVEGDRVTARGARPRRREGT